jgi:hypothetical protein
MSRGDLKVDQIVILGEVHQTVDDMNEERASADE